MTEAARAAAPSELVKLPTQVFLSKGFDPPAAERLQPILDERLWKPKGGLWTSSLADGASGWERWLWSEQPDWYAGGRRWLLEPVPARVFEIDGWAALERLFSAYGCDLYELPGFRGARHSWSIRWAEWAEDYDALHLTEEGLWGSAPSGLPARYESMFVYGWDCESTIWARWCFASVSGGGAVVAGEEEA